MNSTSDGYTLIELIVALSLVFLLGSLASASYLVAVDWLGRWRAQSELENKAHVLMHRMGKDLRIASSILSKGDNEWHVMYQHERSYAYKLSNQQLYRQDVLLHDSTLKVLGVELIQKHRTIQGGQSLLFTNISLHIASRLDSFTVSTTVGQRAPARWDVLEY